MQIEWLKSIGECAASEWDKLNTTGNPFMQHGYFSALEESGCTRKDSGWEPQHLIIRKDGELIAAMPLYIKYHSYGEYVFDWSWADAWRSCGLDYYPKLLSAVPFTPSTGPRFLSADPAIEKPETKELLETIARVIRQVCIDNDYSGWHLLFPEKSISDLLLDYGCMQRMGYQFHWMNRNYACFEDFTATFASRKRKNLNKERDRVKNQGLEFRTLRGHEIDKRIWQRFFTFYQLTYLKRSGHHGYLNLDFFLRIGQTMASKVMMVLVLKDDEPVAAALNFVGKDTLYGRYWGCLEEFDFLHFETCYYQGIEFCIREKLQRFDAGAQGEHKIQRGFEPVPVWSNHIILHEELGPAISDFLTREKQAVEHYINDAKDSLPFNTQHRSN